MKKRYTLVSLAVSCILALCACSQNTGREPSNTERDDVVVSINMVVNSLDPHDNYSLVQEQVLQPVYESLYVFDESTREYLPRLATGYTLSDDGLEYIFTLREDVKFHNGEEMKASDVVFSVERAKQNASLNTYTSPIAECKAVDEHTVSFTLHAPYAPFIHHLRKINIVSEVAVAETGEENMASAICKGGTGPYVITSYEPDTAIQYEAFPEYYRGEASIKRITVKPYTDLSTGLIAFENGELDFYAVPLANWKDISESGLYNTTVVASNHISFFGINPMSDYYSDQNLRYAVQHCINREALNDVAYEGYAETTAVMNKAEYVVGAPEEQITFDYDPDKAREYLAAAGYPDGFDGGSILTISGQYFEKMAQNLQSSLSQVGISVTIDAYEQGAYIDTLVNGSFDIVVCGWAAEFDYDAHWSLVSMFSEGFEPLSSLQPLFEEAALETDLTQRSGHYRDIDKRIMETGVFAPVFFKTTPYAWNKQLNASVGSTLYSIYDWSWNRS